MIEPVFLLSSTLADTNKPENITSDLFAALIKALSSIAEQSNGQSDIPEPIKETKQSTTPEENTQNSALFYSPLAIFSHPILTEKDGQSPPSPTAIETNKYLSNQLFARNSSTDLTTLSNGEASPQSSAALQALAPNPSNNSGFSQGSLKPGTNSIAEPTSSPILKNIDNAAILPFNDLPNPRIQTDFAQHVKQALPHQTFIPPSEQIVVHVTHAVLEKLDKIDITLFPPDLGKVKVEMAIDDDKKIQAVFRIEKAQTMDMLFRDQKNIEQSLNNIGLKVEDGAMRFELSQQQDHSSHQNHRREQETEVAPILTVDDENSTINPYSSNQSLIDLAI